MGKTMPLIEMTFGKGALTAEQKLNLARKVTELVVQEAGQPKDYTWIVIHGVPLENWLVGGLTIQEVKAKMAEK